MNVRLSICRVLTGLLLLATSGVLPTAADQGEVNAPYVPTPMSTVETMLRLAGVTSGDIIYDLGSGDGRIPITAVRAYGARKGVGIDIDPALVRLGNENARKAGIADRVRFVQGDVLKADFSEATVVTMYLLPDLNLALRPRLLALRPGTRIVSHQFDLGEWFSDHYAVIEVPGQGQVFPVEEDGNNIFLWIVPANVRGVWQWTADSGDWRLHLDQDFQEIGGRLRAYGQDLAIGEPRLTGDRLRFTARGNRDGRAVSIDFEGTVSGNSLRGTLVIDGRKIAITARRDS